MKQNLLALVAFVGLGLFASCKQKDVDPNKGGSNDPQNIREVAALLQSAGKLPEGAKPKTELTKCDTLKKESAGIQKLEYTGENRDCDKVSTEEHYDYIGRSEEFAILDPWASILWPGCLIQGASIRGDNVPTAIPIVSKRKPGKILLQIVSGADSRLTGKDQEGSWSEPVKTMNESSVLQAQNNLLRRWRESGIPASTSYSMEVVHSLKETAIATGLDIDKFFGKIQAAFRTDFSESKSYVLVKLYQRFYTLSYEDPEGFKGVFADNIQRSDLAPYTGPGNPICYISSVSYGRIYYLLYESSEKSDVLMTSLKSSFASINIDGSIKQNEVVSNSRVHLIQRGGDAQLGLEGAINPNKVADFIIKGATPSEKNVGAPISFTVKHLYDASLVRMSNTTSYSYRKTQFIPKSKFNTVTVLLRDISVHASSKGKYQISSNAHVRLVDATVEYVAKTKPKTRPAQREFSLMPDGKQLLYGLRSLTFINVYKAQSNDCGFAENDRNDRVLLRVKLAIRPEAYHNGFLGTGLGGSRTGESEQFVEFIQELEYETKEGWEAVAPSSPYSYNAFQSISRSLDLTDLQLNVSVNYSVYVDNTRLRPQSRNRK
ncbi:hypothetical protein HMPREF9134_01379 [Porphyromonas catoniae F0037]|jgi:listeriolysin O|uniref:Thiol-activated cytolysin n=1 Tax=Porphyromonas catoniae F0037 TaxID=1127696 RepID=L1NBQ3_9PORP|nr:thiol-activated cytolysin family protein [Porphyromonas catoniae]EKY00642.1 hypothetical protein HMPREF9134_01379 [Porphyromonas catoniae F0037]